MEQALAYLQYRIGDDWLISDDSEQFLSLFERLYVDLTEQASYGIPPKVLLVEPEPVRFLAGFMAACAAGCPVFLGNPGWAQKEWEQVFQIVQPDLILGYSDWGVRDYNPNPQAPMLSSGWIMIPTGGSSGKIRFAIHTWETLMASVRGFQRHFQTQQVNSFCVLPLYHVSGLMQFIRSFTSGGQLVIMPFKELASNQRCDINPANFFISLVSTQLQRLLEDSVLTDWLAGFQTVLLGGSPAWAELLELARHQQIQLSPIYGMTETASGIVALKPQEFLESNQSNGQVLPHAEVSIRSPSGELLEPKQVGNIWIKAESLALGYYPEISNHQDGFLSDDLGFFNDQGYLHIVGRHSNKIITGGENVFPSEVEAEIRATGLVKDICVIGMPDPHWGQVVTAIYVPSNLEVSPQLLQIAIIDKLSKYKQPKYWIPVKTLPRNAQGKVNSKELQQIAINVLKIFL